MNRYFKRGPWRAMSLALITLVCACTPMSYQQKENLRDMQAEGFYVQEKSKGGAVALGFLPGGGSFYTGRWGVGIVDVLFWPLSMAWDPVVGYTEARYRNYRASWNKATAVKKSRVEVLQREYEDRGMSREVYAAEIAELNEQFSFLVVGKP